MRDYDGKTATERVTERRDKLFEAGFELFGQHGYAGTSIRAVLRQSGLIDRYWAENFADLDSLLAAVYDRTPSTRSTTPLAVQRSKPRPGARKPRAP